MNMKTILAAALTAGFFVQPCMTALASVSAPESDKNQIGPGFEAPAEENAESAFTPWTKVDGVYVDDTGKAIDGAVLRGVSVSKWQGDVDWGKAAADDISFALVRMASIGYEGEYTGAVLRGVSVSKWQGDVDWGKAAADDISFALVRMASIGYEGEYTMDEYFDQNMREASANGVHVTPYVYLQTRDISFALVRMASIGYEGEYTMDEYFDQNMREASANGVHVTPYVYLQTRTVEEAEAAARYAVDVAKNYDVSYPLAVDIESQYILDLSTQELTDIANAFCRVVAEAGYTPIVYSDYHKFTTEMDTNQIPYDIWLARYGGDHNYPNRTMWQATAGYTPIVYSDYHKFTTEMDTNQIPYDIWLARYGGDHNYPNRTMWQATDKGVIDGINGNVCLEFAFKDYAPALEAGDATPGQWKEENGVTMWQATDKGVIDGINGNVCLEFAFKDYAPALEAGDATPGQWKEENGVWYFENNDKGVIDGINGNVCLEFAFKDYAPALEAGDATPGQWKEENGVWYFENNGGRYTGWIRPDGNWYYMDPAAGGAMVSNTSMVIDGVTYSFNGSGVMQ